MLLSVNQVGSAVNTEYAGYSNNNDHINSITMEQLKEYCITSPQIQRWIENGSVPNKDFTEDRLA